MFGSNKRVIAIPSTVAESNSKRIRLVSCNLPSLSNDNNFTTTAIFTSSVSSTATPTANISPFQLSSGALAVKNESSPVVIPVNLQFQPATHSGSLFSGKIALQPLPRFQPDQVKLVVPKAKQLPGNRVISINEISLCGNREQTIPGVSLQNKLVSAEYSQTAIVQPNAIKETSTLSGTSTLIVRPLQNLRIVSSKESSVLLQQSKVSSSPFPHNKSAPMPYHQGFLSPSTSQAEYKFGPIKELHHDSFIYGEHNELSREYLPQSVSPSPTDIKEEELELDNLSGDELSPPPEACLAKIPKIKCKMCPQFVKDTSSSETCEDCYQRMNKVKTVFQNIAKVKSQLSSHTHLHPVRRHIPLQPVLRTYSPSTKVNIIQHKDAAAAKLELKLIYKLVMVRFRETPKLSLSQNEIEHWVKSKCNLGNFRISEFNEKLSAVLAGLVKTNDIVACSDSNHTASYRLRSLQESAEIVKEASKGKKVFSESEDFKTSDSSENTITTVSKMTQNQTGKIVQSDKSSQIKNSTDNSIYSTSSATKSNRKLSLACINNIASKTVAKSKAESSRKRAKIGTSSSKSKGIKSRNIDVVSLSSSDNENEAEQRPTSLTAKANDRGKNVHAKTTRRQGEKVPNKSKLNLILVANPKANSLPSVRMSPSLSYALPKATNALSGLSWITEAVPSTMKANKKYISQRKSLPAASVNTDDFLPSVRMSPSLIAASPTRKKQEIKAQSNPVEPATSNSKQSLGKNKDLNILDSHLKSKIAVFKCPHCSKPFFQYSLLDYHLYRFHKGSSPYHCKECKKRFPYWKMFLIHRRIHQQDLDLVCRNCGKNFGDDQSEYCNHIKLHGESLLRCQFCPKEFSTTKYLDIHLISDHRDLNPLSCLEKSCQVSFVSFTDYCKHVQDVHKLEKCKLIITKGSKLPVLKKNPVFNLYTDVRMNLKCERCSASVCTINHLHRHMKDLHELGPRIKCNTCEKMIRRDFLPRHLSICHKDEEMWNWDMHLKKFVHKMPEVELEDVDQLRDELPFPFEDESSDDHDHLQRVSESCGRASPQNSSSNLFSTMTCNSVSSWSREISNKKHKLVQVEPQRSYSGNNSKPEVRTYANKKKLNGKSLQGKKFDELKSPRIPTLRTYPKKNKSQQVTPSSKYTHGVSARKSLPDNESCKLCPANGRLKSTSYMLHEKTHDPDNPYPCPHPQCEKRFSQLHFAFFHYRIAHQSVQKYIEKREQLLNAHRSEQEINTSLFVSLNNSPGKRYVIMKRMKTMLQTSAQSLEKSDFTPIRRTKKSKTVTNSNKDKGLKKIGVTTRAGATAASAATEQILLTTHSSGPQQVLVPSLKSTKYIPGGVWTNDGSSKVLEEETSENDNRSDILQHPKVEQVDDMGSDDLQISDVITATEDEIATAIKEVYPEEQSLMPYSIDNEFEDLIRL